ncbi:hypothetical protein GIB67_013926 [Kingdonia uniflora]|uniref:Uncharacterized protein n=1 Tax=Kingdonia uniflora TaxID=39325 RepID=A0A7J7LDC9_9MAGN|nr:hypothetical protein GIB67_013926 [Kingdonia uniflora]
MLLVRILSLSHDGAPHPEYNLEDVDATILVVRVALANGRSWEDLARMVKDEKRSGNPVAGLIDKLHLE